MAPKVPPTQPTVPLARLFSPRAKRLELVPGPIRGEPLGADRLAERARALAAGQRLAAGRGQRQALLLARLRETRGILDDAHARLTAAAAGGADVGPAGEWLLDNYHVVDEHVREVHESLPRQFYRELPELAAGPLAGYPRVYEIAVTIIAHTEGRIRLDSVELFVSAFEERTPLSLGELWAMPAVLRLGLVENVRRMTLRTVQWLDEIEAADAWAARIHAAHQEGGSALGVVLSELVHDHPPFTSIFVSRFLQQLRLVGGEFTPLAWLEQWLAEDGLSAVDAASRSSERLALTQLGMANSITSLRAIARMDWRSFVERQSKVETVLRDDPSGFYPRMTFATRDEYRHAVERIAKRSRLGETAVARAAIDLARAASSDGDDEMRLHHVGYYLVDAGLEELERRAGYRPRARERVHRTMLRHPNAIFVGGILAGTLAALAALLSLAAPATRPGWILAALFALLPANEVAVRLVNQLITTFLPPRILPKLELREHGIPPEFRTVVVVPTLFPHVDAVREALEHLEVQFLANRDTHLHFAILSDFADAPTETTAEDDEIVAAAVEGIRALNARYGAEREDVFYLLHRPRRWNPQQGVWMGWERKRGKLAEFNRCIHGDGEEGFSTIVGDLETIRRARYVITLDADTVLPPQAAALLVGTIAHPLNRAVYDPALGRVVRGYGVIQPRVGIALPSAFRSYFAEIHSGHPGVDPYTTAVSDVYQDLYGEGSYTGKGIYDVDAFERVTGGRFPENTLLSHDLIEGSYARAGLATDIQVYDDYPTRYLTYTRRKHRWIRGDWQLLEWLTPHVPGPNGPESNRLSLLSRWKIFDNLRRSVVEPAQLLLLVAGWTILSGTPLRWTVLGLVAIGAPWAFALLLAVLRPPRDKSWRAYYASVGEDAKTSALQFAVAVAFLPHQAWVSADAIARTLWRLFVSRRTLLEWQTASQTEQSVSGTAREVWRAMWPAVAVAAAILVVVIPGVGREGTAQLLAVAPLVALWMASPALARAFSAPTVRRLPQLSAQERAQALRYALLHWRYFDRFMTADTNWLAPDNFQENPDPVVAMRTSPTNIGLQLLATVSAYDLGFIGAGAMAERLELTLRTLERMRRFRGHFYNWYDLHDLRVLEPAYISTVDSGNLAGHLIAVRQACLAVPGEPVRHVRMWRALETALALAGEHLSAPASAGEGGEAGEQAAARTEARERLHAARAAIPRPDHTIDARAFAAAFDAIAAHLARARDALASASPDETSTGAEWITWSLDFIAARRAEPALDGSVTSGSTAPELRARLEALADRAYRFAMEMDFRFLYDSELKLFAIGYLQGAHALDNSHYDLLASEARLASYLAIARHDVPPEHWFRLGRTLTHAGGETTLVSWSGSMFEYLMPLLVLRSFPATLLDQTYHGVVNRQLTYGAERGVPWGISESAYNVRDREQTYQYRAFGIPDIALKRGLGRDLVVAPYASALAALLDPPRALSNLHALERLGALGTFGFYDSLDYTRPDAGRRYAVVRTHMAHHVGMSLVALTNVLTAQLWQRRFHADPLIRSAELLLQERIPRRLVFQTAPATSADEALPDPELERPVVREIESPDTPHPAVALLGHLPYTLMVSNSGSGYSRYEGLAVTRWRADGTRDNTGQFCYVKDVSRGRVWSATHQPVRAPADWYRVLLATDRVTFVRVDDDIETRTEIVAVPADAAEVRRITLTNNGDAPRELELTSYGEIVLGSPDADRAHPAFANLFVETEYHEWCSAVTATRRPRSMDEQRLWLVHVVATGTERVGPVTCETDRARFLGRGRSTADPVAMEHDGALPGTTGAVLDPIFALRTRVRLEPGRSASVTFTTLVATTRERAFELADRYDDPHAAQRALDLAWTGAHVELRELNLTPNDAAVYQELAGHLFYPNPTLRAPQDELRRNRGSQPLLWALGVSGDWPILLATIDSPEGLPTLRQLLAAHHYWRRRGMTVDLVVLNMRPSTYQQELQDRITSAVLASSEAAIVDRPGGVFLRRSDTVTPETLLMLRATARVHIACAGQGLGRVLTAAEQRAEAAARGAPEQNEADDADMPPAPHLRLASRVTPMAVRVVRRLHSLVRADTTGRARPAMPAHHGGHAEDEADGAPLPRRDLPPLLFDNGLGGLTDTGDYEIRLRDGHLPPAPWINVVANARGGFLVSERGAGFTWAENSQFFRLTPWQNDPVTDPPTEVLYLRDEETRDVWSATPAPLGHDGSFIVRHGAGSSTFEQIHRGIETQLTLGMAGDEPVKVSLLRVSNRGDKPRRLSLTAYVEWSMGVLREHTQHQVHTWFDQQEQAMFARNTFEPQFAERVAFCAVSLPVSGHTGDRGEFLGRNGGVDDPAGMRAEALSGTTGADIDPCAALRCAFELAPDETRELVVVLGAGDDEAAARGAVAAYRDVDRATAALEGSRDAWDKRLAVIRVRTPEPSFDALINRWTLYQALACRMWGRSALYQSSGAYGFRDQLQDVMAFVYAEPAVAREHILLAASRQFVEGDVQHWWHPPSGRGVRTRFSDDLVWLPFVVSQYVHVTGDATVLDEQVPFLVMRPLEPHEHEVYDLPKVSDERASVYEHCLRALRKACTRGAHGLPLMGSGDWNDGMNRVGVEGRGESVWLAWFLVTVLRSFAEHAEARGDAAVTRELRREADAYAEAVEAHAWDGAWYRRAYFDDGTPLGSAANDECRIDSIAQSWSVISGAGEPARQAQAMRSLEEHLVRDDARLITLLTPPFDKTAHDPGYIKGYLPGVRENGAQYTHAALWAVLATALHGDGNRAFELYQMLNPLTHTSTPADVERYKVEPYVVAADVYTAAGHLGRGGWTWYTGSASWMYRVGLEVLLGFTKRGDTLEVRPRVPADWPELTIEYRFGKSTYVIVVREPGSSGRDVEVSLDERVLDTPVIPLVDDGARHEVRIRAASRAGSGTPR